jgi:hypothetical protein
MEGKSSGGLKELREGLSQLFSCMVWAVFGGIAGSFACMLALIILDAAVFNPGSPDAGQLGVLGPFIGGPVGGIAGLVCAGIQAGRRQTGAAEVNSKTARKG